ncbi:hypothetical protein AB0P28_09400 [Pseudarthrobacter sp. NPDC089323]
MKDNRAIPAFETRAARSLRESMWSSLEPGDLVTLGRQGYEHYSGRVDERTADGRTIWVIDRIGDRRLFHIDDDYELSMGITSDGGTRLWPARGGGSSLGLTT